MHYTCKTYYSFINRRFFALIISIFTLIDFQGSQKLYSQQISEKDWESDIKNFNEELYIQTDRDIYITGEQVWFKVYKMYGLTHIPCDISKVVYVELLDKNNFPLKQLKVRIDGNSGSSGFILPDNISSGNYVIRSYTSWMKNFSADMFFYKEISVINPFESIDHFNIPSGGIFADTGSFNPDNYSQIIVSDEKKNMVSGSSQNKFSGQQLKYAVTLQKQEFSQRERVRILISASDIAGNPVVTDLSVSVAKSDIINPTDKNISSLTGQFKSSVNEKSFSENTYTFLPELEGLLLSGNLKLKSTDEPLRNAYISLSYIGKTARCQFGKTDENGEFNFVIKENGLDEIVIQPLSVDISGFYVELAQPFLTKFSNYKTSPFYIDSSKLDKINNAIISMQISNIYEPYHRKQIEVPVKNLPDFYGKPENTIKMSDYIELTSIREVVKEIIPNVYTLKQNGKYDFKLINKFRGHPFENKPLVLVDGVPIYDFEKVLNINSKEIERADIINTRYFISDIVFDGILSFITKKGNLSALEYDNSIFRQVYEACQIQNNFYSPDYSTEVMKNNRIPDYRNTLYWAPDQHTTKDGKTVVEFYTSDESAEYTIVVEGISADGKTGFSTAFMVVK